MEVFSLFASLGLNDVQFKRGLDGAEKRFQQVGQNLTRVGQQLTTRVTLPITLMGGAILKVAGDFEQSMNRVQALTGATGDQFDSLRQKAEELGRTTQFSASQAADAMGFLAMAGFDADQILGSMEGTLRLAAAANLDLASSADIVSNIMTGFGIEVDDLDNAVDVLTKTFISANTDLSQLGQAFTYAGPVAKGAGLTFEETAAALGLMGNAGIQASMAGTSLRGAISRLLNPTKQIQGALDSLGISAKDTDGNLRPMVEIVEQLETSGATTADMMLIFGDRAGPAMAGLVSQGSDALRNLTSELQDSGGTAERIANVQMQGLNGAFREFRSAIEGLMLAIARSGLLEWFESMVRSATRFIQGLSELNPLILQIGTVAAGAMALAGPLLIALGTLPGILKAVTTGFTLLRAAMLFMGPGGLIAGAIALLAGASGFAWALGQTRDAVDDARDALAANDKPSLLRSLKEVERQAKGDTRQALIDLQREIIHTGDISVEQGQRIAAALSAAERGMVESRLNAAQTELDIINGRLEAYRDLENSEQRIQEMRERGFKINEEEREAALAGDRDRVAALQEEGRLLEQELRYLEAVANTGELVASDFRELFLRQRELNAEIEEYEAALGRIVDLSINPGVGRLTPGAPGVGTDTGTDNPLADSARDATEATEELNEALDEANETAEDFIDQLTRLNFVVRIVTDQQRRRAEAEREAAKAQREATRAATQARVALENDNAARREMQELLMQVPTDAELATQALNEYTDTLYNLSAAGRDAQNAQNAQAQAQRDLHAAIQAEKDELRQLETIARRQVETRRQAEQAARDQARAEREATRAAVQATVAARNEYQARAQMAQLLKEIPPYIDEATRAVNDHTTALLKLAGAAREVTSSYGRTEFNAPSLDFIFGDGSPITVVFDELKQKTLTLAKYINDAYLNLGTFGEALVDFAIEKIPVIGAGIVAGFKEVTDEAGKVIGFAFDPISALVSAFFDLLGRSQIFGKLIEAINRVLTPLAEIVGAVLLPAFVILAPLLQGLATVLTWIANGLIRVYNALFARFWGRIPLIGEDDDDDITARVRRDWRTDVFEGGEGRWNDWARPIPQPNVGGIIGSPDDWENARRRRLLGREREFTEGIDLSGATPNIATAVVGISVDNMRDIIAPLIDVNTQQLDVLKELKQIDLNHTMLFGEYVNDFGNSARIIREALRQNPNFSRLAALGG